jgi:hypothetical protein
LLHRWGAHDNDLVASDRSPALEPAVRIGFSQSLRTLKLFRHFGGEDEIGQQQHDTRKSDNILEPRSGFVNGESSNNDRKRYRDAVYPENRRPVKISSYKSCRADQGIADDESNSGFSDIIIIRLIAVGSILLLVSFGFYFGYVFGSLSLVH